MSTPDPQDPRGVPGKQRQRGDRPMSYDTWDKAIDAARAAGGELGRTIAAWQDVPQGDADQLINEAADAFKDAAAGAFRQAQDREED